MMPTNEEILIELRRELKMRERVYPRWLSDGKFTLQEYNRRMDRLKAAIAHFENLEKAQGSLSL